MKQLDSVGDVQKDHSYDGDGVKNEAQQSAVQVPMVPVVVKVVTAFVDFVVLDDGDVKMLNSNEEEDDKVKKTTLIGNDEDATEYTKRK